MAKRPRDTVLIESVEGGGFSIVVDRSTQYELVLDLLAPSVARFEIGDSGTWGAIRDALGIGGTFQVSINGSPRLRGRLLTRNLAVSADAGATVQVMVRTRLADAMFTAADPKIGVRNTTIKDVILAAYARMGLTEADFVFQSDVARDLITGRRSGQPDRAAGIRYRIRQAEAALDPYKDVKINLLRKQLSSAEGLPVDPELDTLKEDEARPHPPESIYAFGERHLSRFSLAHWDGPDGRIVVGHPDDSQKASYIMTARRGKKALTNNLLGATKSEDFEEVPANLWVFGVGGGRDQAKARVKYMELDATLAAIDPKLDRGAIIIDEGIRTQEQAAARARREMMRRSLAKDTWVLETDGLSYWSGTESVPYGVDTVADVRVDVAGAASGPYLVRQVAMRGNAQDEHTTQLTCVGKGIWRL
jgi:prophage tail gpP-like protein